MSKIESEEGFPLMDATDNEILMHRNVHFGGKFPLMLDYYRNKGRGVHPNFDLSRLESLAEMEQNLNQDIGNLLLSDADLDKIAEAKNAYQKLKEIYKNEDPKDLHLKLIADLILTEDHDAEPEIAAIVLEKDRIVPFLIDALKQEQLMDPLFPGYGLTPSLIVKVLERIGDKRAIISLFEAIGQGDFEDDDQIFKALKAIGEPAKKFLLTVVKGKPLNEDNEKAAIALIPFREDQEVGELCLEMLSDPEVQKDLSLSTYLAMNCESLVSTSKEPKLAELAENSLLAEEIRKDIQLLLKKSR